MEKQVTFSMIEDAAAALKGTAYQTPLVSAKRISPDIMFKAENLQKTGSFKIRGAYNKIRMLTEEEAARGVIACSAGNHAQGVAISATRRGIRSLICMPASAPVMKMEATRGYGAEVIPVAGHYDDAAAEAARLCREKGFVFVHPFDDPYVIAGQGTIGLEIMEQMPDVEQIIVPVGGGGLISGVALAVKTLKPSCKVIGVQAKGIPSMYGSFALDEVLTVKDAATVADGIHVLTPGKLTFEIVRQYVDDLVVVDEDELCAATVSLMEGPKLVAEGAGASSAAAFLFDKIDTSKRTVCVISGGNVDMKTLNRILTKGNIKLGRLAKIITRVPANTQGLSALLYIIESRGAVVTDMNWDRFRIEENVHTAIVSLTLETTGHEQLQAIRTAMEQQGYPQLNE